MAAERSFTPSSSHLDCGAVDPAIIACTFEMIDHLMKLYRFMNELILLEKRRSLCPEIVSSVFMVARHIQEEELYKPFHYLQLLPWLHAVRLCQIHSSSMS